MCNVCVCTSRMFVSSLIRFSYIVRMYVRRICKTFVSFHFFCSINQFFILVHDQTHIQRSHVWVKGKVFQFASEDFNYTSCRYLLLWFVVVEYDPRFKPFILVSSMCVCVCCSINTIHNTSFWRCTSLVVWKRVTFSPSSPTQSLMTW